MNDTDVYGFSLKKYGFPPRNCGVSVIYDPSFISAMSSTLGLSLKYVGLQLVMIIRGANSTALAVDLPLFG